MLPFSTEALLGYLAAARGPAVSPWGISSSEEQALTRVWLLVFAFTLFFWDSLCFLMSRNTARKTIIDSLFTLPGGKEDL